MSTKLQNIIYLFSSRVLRSFAAGFLAISFSLYLYDVLKMSFTLVGIIFAVGAVSTPLIALAVGVLGDRYGRKPVLLIDLSTLPVAVALILLSRSFWVLLLASALGGFGVAGGLVGGGVGASVGPLITTLLAENTDEANRTTVFSINMVLSTFAGAAGAIMVSFMQFRVLFELGLVLTAMSALMVIPLTERYARVGDRQKETTQLSERDKKFIKAFGITGILNGASQGFVTPFYPIIFEAFFHLSTAQVGYLMTGGGLASGAANAFAPWLAKKLGFLKLIISTRAASATAVLLIPFSPSALVASALYLLATPLRAVSLPVQSSLQMTLISEGRRATSSGINQAARLLASAAATYLGGALMDFMPLFVPFTMASALTYGNSGLYQYFFGDVPEAKSRGVPPQRDAGAGIRTRVTRFLREAL